MINYEKKVELLKNFQDMTNIIDKWEGYADTLKEDEEYKILKQKIEHVLKTL